MIDEIFIFISLVDMGSFSKLSAKLGINQPTISRRVQTLEDKFGILLIRTPQGVRVTEQGKKLYDSFIGYKSAIEHTLMNYSNQDGVKEQITILIPLWISYNVINRLLPQFLLENSKIKLKVIYGDRNVDFIKESIDIAVVTGEQKQSFQIMKYLGSCKQFFYCNNNYVKLERLPANLSELIENHNILGYSYDDNSHKIDATDKINIFSEKNDELITTLTITPSLLVSMYTGASQIMQYSNQYIALDYEFALNDQISSGYYIRVLPEYYAGVREYFITIPERDLSAEKHKVFAFLSEIITRKMSSK